MTSVLAELSRWASTLPYWEQAALEIIVAGSSFTDAKYEQLLRYLQEDAGLAGKEEPRQALCFPENVGTPTDSACGSVRLQKICNLENVNALVAGQTLSFGAALTVSFGGNGSGKSGYARVLGCAGFTRGDREVLADVTLPANPSARLTADIELEDATTTRVIHYEIGSRCPELNSFYVFDTTSVLVHLTKSNALSFSPAGLGHLSQLAAVTDEVRARLQAIVKQCSAPHQFVPLFQGESDVTKIVASLGPSTDLTVLRRLASLTELEHRQLEELDIQIAKLKSEDIPKQIQNVNQTIVDLEEELIVRLRGVEQGLSDEVIIGLRDAANTYLDRQVAAQHVSAQQFESTHFTQTGSSIWRQFIEAAKALADAERREGVSYPGSDDHCLFCRQPLSVEARDLILRIWAFLEGEAQRRLVEASLAVNEKNSEWSSIELSFFGEQSVSYRYLHEYDKELLEKVVAFIEASGIRRQMGLRILSFMQVDSLPPLPDSGASEIQIMVDSLKAHREELESKNPAKQITEVERQLLNLQHRLLLGSYLPQIEEYVKKRAWAERAAKVGGNTRHITEKHNDLLKGLVTDRYVELFEQALKDLGRPVRVKVRTRGQKGKALKQIVLEADPSAPIEKATPDKVLSEGEKRAVALADFLTEVALDESSSGIILDDPVTSLDHEWKERLASRLVMEAKRRQVIIFTHDLPFLYLLRKDAEKEQVECRTHWIKRGDIDGRPGYVYQDNCPALERDYRNTRRARSLLERATVASPEEQETLLKEGFGALRTTYEAFIIFDVLNEVVMRFEERISFGRLKQIVWDKSTIDTVVEKCELLSRFIEAHLHSDAFSAVKPTPKILQAEIESFDVLRGQHNRAKAS